MAFQDDGAAPIDGGLHRRHVDGRIASADDNKRINVSFVVEGGLRGDRAR
jgi:hypothetical protein